ncbi:DUF427 domain-containing protein [Aureimonas glaciei]|jgi:uncharacterized protein (DUF427 family)|uniref:DUF427 domain-containing protein n=1 Tax=Aureimonas glaciei TaxID=1776957 RepID=A0A916XW14_9HYPH|nr:DUF427 domain-containing protein [Aureimonas glaciei]GGD16197.1 hypothetical protein GCM10011335_18690 [Aureimonas glaciei]
MSLPSDLTFKTEAQSEPVIIRRHDAVIAATKAAVLVHAGEVPVYYVPRADVYEEHLVETEAGPAPIGTGRARFWSVTASGGGVEKAVWMLEDPTGDLESLTGHFGFDPDPFNITVG